ncbi:hypothetical protein AVEN_166105-1 [Araneus ventricosus]|uniref:Uncharacterized protein n=1 Tax=Araneus ventricosus TaxID=182803 RepID=A0A4Y2FQ97_ARAVE|nr:hypothetical protein AVEN_166105-1 [Araneus ventricosus]
MTVSHKLKDLKKTSKDFDEQRYDEESAKEWWNTIINERKETEEIAEQKRQEEIAEPRRQDEIQTAERRRQEEIERTKKTRIRGTEAKR